MLFPVRQCFIMTSLLRCGTCTDEPKCQTESEQTERFQGPEGSHVTRPEGNCNIGRSVIVAILDHSCCKC